MGAARMQEYFYRRRFSSLTTSPANSKAEQQYPPILRQGITAWRSLLELDVYKENQCLLFLQFAVLSPCKTQTKLLIHATYLLYHIPHPTTCQKSPLTVEVSDLLEFHAQVSLSPAGEGSLLQFCISFSLHRDWPLWIPLAPLLFFCRSLVSKPCGSLAVMQANFKTCCPHCTNVFLWTRCMDVLHSEKVVLFFTSSVFIRALALINHCVPLDWLP